MVLAFFIGIAAFVEILILIEYVITFIRFEFFCKEKPMEEKDASH